MNKKQKMVSVDEKKLEACPFMKKDSQGRWGVNLTLLKEREKDARSLEKRARRLLQKIQKAAPFPGGTGIIDDAIRVCGGVEYIADNTKLDRDLAWNPTAPWLLIHRPNH
jgi:hypothetical protein